MVVDGATEGDFDGSPYHAQNREGFAVGIIDGFREGKCEGFTVGKSVGWVVGFEVGEVVGDTVGLDVFHPYLDDREASSDKGRATCGWRLLFAPSSSS